MAEPMKALSIRVPWWWFILYGGKDIENRDWPTGFRGTIYLHASKWYGVNEVMVDYMSHRALMTSSCVPNFIDIRRHGGCLVGTVEIVDCVTRSTSRWFAGKYGLVLRNPVPLASPIPCKGALGLFTPQLHLEGAQALFPEVRR